MNFLLRALLGGQVSLAIRLLIWELGLSPSPFSALDGRSWLRGQTLVARHRSCACFWRIVTQICARNRFSVRVLIKGSSTQC